MKKKLLAMLLTAAMAVSLTACGSAQEAGDEAAAEPAQAEEADAETDAAAEEETAAEEESGDVQTIVVSMDGATAPFNYQDENGELVGYEVDVLNEIANRAGDIQFEYNITTWDGIFASVDSGKADMIVNNITKKPEREEKYLFSDYAYFINHTVIVVPKGETAIQSIDDLQGQSVESEAGVAVTLFLEEYNEQHPDNPINISYTDAGISSIISNVATGRYPACIYAQTYVDEVVKQLGIEVDCISIPNEDEIQSSEAWFLYSRDDEELKAKIDPILNEMIEDGTLSELCEKWMGADYTK